MNRKIISSHQGLPTWVYFVAGVLAPIPSLRWGDINITGFDVFMLCLALLLVISARPIRAPFFVMALSYVMMAAMSITIIRSPDPIATFIQLLQWLFIFLIVVPVTYSLFRWERAFVSVSWGFAAAMAIVAAYGVYEVFYIPIPYRAYRYRSILGDPQVLGFQIAVTMPFLIFLLRRLGSSGRLSFFRSFLGLMLLLEAGLLMWLLFHTFSRTGMLATILGTGLFVFLDLLFTRRGLFRKLTREGALILIMTVAGITVFLSSEVGPRLISRVTEQTLDPTAHTVSARTSGYLEAIRGVDESYHLLGVGPDNYQNIPAVTQKKPHNVILLLGVEGGVVVVFTFLLLLGYFFVRTLSSLRVGKAGFLNPFIIAAITSMAAYVVISMLNTQLIPRYYWFVFALGLAAAYHQRNREIEGTFI